MFKLELCWQAHAEAEPQQEDPAVAKQKAAEAEEQRLAAIRAHGTPVTAGASTLLSKT